MHVFSTFLVCFFFHSINQKKKISTNGTMLIVAQMEMNAVFGLNFPSVATVTSNHLSIWCIYIVENNSARTLPTIPSNVNNISFKECILRIFRNHIARLFPFLWCPLCFFSCGKCMQKTLLPFRCGRRLQSVGECIGS